MARCLALLDHLAALGSDQPKVRLNAIKSLGSIGSGAAPAILALVAALNDPDDQLKKAATSAIEAIGPAALPHITFSLHEGTGGEIRSRLWDIADQLASRKGAGPILLRSLQMDNDPAVRAHSARLLGDIQAASPEVVPIT